MSSDTPRWKPSFVPDPLTYLVELQAVLPWRMVVDRHFVYGAMDRSARTGAGRVRPSFDNSWGCFDQCRPHKEEAEAGRVLSGFHNLSMFVSIVPNGERAVAQRLAKALGYLYVTVPTGYHLAVLSTGPLGEHSTEVVDKDRHMKKVLMKVRWFGSISSSHGFLPKARDAVGWEAYHP